MNSHYIGLACACILAVFSSNSPAVSVSGQGTWETTLKPRDLDSNPSTIEAWYDTDLLITWLADANYAQTSGSDTDGLMSWSAANSWATGLSIGSVSGWRLPTVTDTGTPGCNLADTGTDCGYNVDTSTGEMAHMFYTTLGDKAYHNTSGDVQAGYGLSNTGPFNNLQPTDSSTQWNYWSGTADASNSGQAWMFYFGGGYQGVEDKTTSPSYAWAVHAGDVGTAIVPLPAAVWLFSGGLLGLIGLGRKRRR